MADDKEFSMWPESAAFAYEVVDGEFVVVTPDGADLGQYAPLSQLLARMRRAFGIETVFIAQFAAGEPVMRCKMQDEGDACAADALQALYGSQLLAAMAGGPCDDARFEALPVVTADGVTHGTLCCRHLAPEGSESAATLGALRSLARLIGAWFGEADLTLSGLMPLQGASVLGGLPLH